MTITRRARTAALTALLLLAAAQPAFAQDKPGLSTSGSMRDALAKLGEGRDVELVLANGKSYRGKLGAVGTETVIVSQIAGKEFFDALIDLDEVAAVEVRARGN